MEPIGLTLGVVSAVLQTYTAVTSAYDVYLSVREFPSTYRELRTAFMVERYRLEQWGDQMLAGVQQERLEQSQHNMAVWKLFQAVFDAMWAAFQESNKTLEDYGHIVGVPKSGEMSDAELLESMQISVTSPKKRSILGMARSIKFVLRDKKKMEALVKELCYWNDSLDKMTSRLEQESARRRLRVKFSTGNVDQLQDLQAAAALLQHRDLENMASARTVIEKSYNIENSPKQPDGVKAQPDSTAPDGGTDFRLEMNQLNWQGLPFMTDQSRAMATYRGEGIIVDWRLCRDDTWRRQNPKAFRQRTENLTRVLNSDLRALNVAVLHCIGYLDQSSTVTGYAFKVPPDVTAGQKPITLHQLLTNPNMRPSDVPDLGDRFELAKVLATTVFEILNIGWLHKNIQPKNVLFWPKRNTRDDWDLSKPYLVGFDISRPNQPGEMSEKPLADPDDDIYRHPDYRSAQHSHPFLPSFDMYSLGIMLFEIGIWRNVGYQGTRRSSRPNLETHKSDPKFIEKVVMDGPVMDLKRHMGARYRDAVLACLNMEFDEIWTGVQGGDGGGREERLKRFQGEVQRRVVDAIAVCSA
ncbi:MAG: hypothetical protein L6R39_006880 [Caloplaca ligustica]|nr:MAG: hypothetical protein L6R39_006880 [Caloplaca ligustica]